MAASRQALDLAAALGDSAFPAEASLYLGHAYEAIGDFGRAAELLQANVAATPRRSDHPRSTASPDPVPVQALLVDLGALETAEGRRPARRRPCVSPPWKAAAPHRSLSTPSSAACTLPRGTWSTPSACAPAWPVACLREPEHVATARRRPGLCRCAPGAPHAEGRALLEEAVPRKSQHRRASCGLLGVAQRGLSSGGTRPEALQHVHQALDLARQQQDRGDEVLALHQLGVVLAHAQPRCHAGGRQLPASPGSGRGTRHAPAPSALPPWPRHAVRHHRPAGGGSYGPDDGDHDVPRYGHGILAPEAEAALAQVDAR